MGASRRAARLTRPIALSRAIGIVILLLLGGFALAQETSGGVQELPVPVLVDGLYAGEITVQAGPDESISVKPLDLFGLISAWLDDRVVQDAEKLFAGNPWSAVDQFAPLGIDVVFDWDELGLVVIVPPLLSRPVVIPLSGRPELPVGITVAPSKLSLITNLDLWSRYSYESSDFEVRMSPEVAANLDGGVLEASGGLQYPGDLFFLNYARFSYDFPEIGYRIEAGDLRYRDIELPDVNTMTGVSFVSNPGLRITEPSAFIHELYADADGELEIYLNDSRLQSRRIESGNYILEKFPLVQGINTIIVQWMTDEGPMQVELVVPTDAALLTPREFRAGVAAGIADRDFHRPVVTSYQTYGLSDRLTIHLREGISILDLGVDTGGYLLLASRAGNFQLSPSFGFAPDGRRSVEIPLSYRYLDSRPSRYRSLGLNVGYLASRPALPDVVTPPPMASSFYFGGFVNLAFADGFSLTPRFSYTLGAPEGFANELAHDLRVQAALRKSIRGGSALTANIGLAHDGDPQLIATLTFSSSFPEARQNLFLQQDLATRKLNAYWSRYAGEAIHDVDYSAGISLPAEFADPMSLNAQVGYINPFLRATLAHGTAGIIDTLEFHNATQLSLQTAFAMAGGEFGVSTPIGDSFILIKPGETLEGVPLTVHQTNGGMGFDLLPSGRVVGAHGSNGYTEILVEPQDVLLGSEDSELRYVVRPTQRSGTLITVELPRNIYVGGVLHNQQGEPIRYQLGTYSRIATEPSEEEVQATEAANENEFFTDEDGYFEIYNVTPGHYELRLEAIPNLLFAFTVSDDAEEFYDAGEIRGSEMP